MLPAALARRPRLPWLIVPGLLGLSLLLCGLGGWRVAQPRLFPEPAAPGGVLTIVSDLPLSGIEPTQDLVRAMQLRLDQAGGRACGGQYAVRYLSWDDAAGGAWDKSAEAANAQRAAADASVIAYLGPFNSPAARVSIPILNQAEPPLLMVGLANSYPGLTKAVGGVPNEPQKYYPSGLRNYVRLNMTDEVQGGVDARYLREQLHAQTVYILDDGLPYGLGIADAFQAAAAPLGLTVLGRARIDPNAADYQTLMGQISLSNAGRPPDAIFASMVVDSNAAQVLKDKVTVMGDNTRVAYLGTTGIKVPAFIESAGARVAEGIIISQPGLGFDQLPAAAQQFRRDFEARYNEHPTNPYVAVAYEAMSATLAAVERVCAAGGRPTDRAAVRDAMFATRSFNGVLGVWSLDPNGDISLTGTSFYTVHNGAFVPLGQ